LSSLLLALPGQSPNASSWTFSFQAKTSPFPATQPSLLDLGLELLQESPSLQLELDAANICAEGLLYTDLIITAQPHSWFSFQW